VEFVTKRPKTVVEKSAIARWLTLGLFFWVQSMAVAQQAPAVAGPGYPAATQTPSTLQSGGEISGTVVDQTGAEVVGAQVTLKQGTSSTSQEALTGNDGQFKFINVGAGEFQLTITAAGFAAESVSGTLRPGEIRFVPLKALAPATKNTAVEVTASQSEIAEAEVKIEEKQRVLGAIPNFYVTYNPDPVPLGAKQKFDLAARIMIDPVSLFIAGATAGIQQAGNNYSEYGQGAQGFGKRFGALYADSATNLFIGGAILPTLLHQDPRYFYKGTGSAHSRLLYALKNVVICKGDNKHWEPNYSGVLGSLASGGISNLYYPANDRGLRLTVDNTLIGLGASAALNVLQEFVLKKFTSNVPDYGQAKR
jgi:hypothetical protein